MRTVCEKVALKLPADDIEEIQKDVEKGAPKASLEQERGKFGKRVNKEGQQPSASTGSSCCNSHIATAGILTLLRQFPHLLAAPVILFCLVVALCTFGIVHASNASYNLEGEQARDAALTAADGLAKQLSSASKATMCLAAVVRMNPNWSFLESNFHVLADELFRQSDEDDNDDSLALMELSLLPFGRFRTSLGKPLQRNSTADIFSPGLIDELETLEVVEEAGLHVKGPSLLMNSDAQAFSAGYPVFFSDADEDESWGHPDNITHPTGCPGPPCYNPQTRRKYWGSVASLVKADSLLAGNSVHLNRLLDERLSYLLAINSHGEGTHVRGGAHPDKVTANVSVVLPGHSWALSVYNPKQAEIVKLRNGLIAMVVVVAFILSGLLLLLLLSNKKASVAWHEQLVANRLLQEEKVAREALLGRQYDLLACFEQSPMNRNESDRTRNSPGQQTTLARIAEARASIADVKHGADEDVSVQELLAEGSFGKVYRGQWRGTDVAVKIILLPSNMSGREKREKMVVWEAAISSSLVHPNICQTYHYRIKPVKESARPGLGMDEFGSAVVFSDHSSSRPKFTIHGGSENKSGSTGSEEVHSYEVHLVLEYCDRSSLRDALDAGAFLAPNGMNYAAQLDCAMDVAKAMLHLHCNNVLHLDLKTRNILLSSSGAKGKGVICKVSDFGLSVYMDHLETHVSSLFHGTVTHMAPEVLLQGTCSKASDVYAFGIVLWELFTCGSPFCGVPPALLGHLIVKDCKRPAWPPVVPKGYRDLVEACWDQNPDARPTFEVILQRLQALRKELGHPTPPLQPISLQRPQRRQPLHLQEDRASPQGHVEPSLPLLRSIDSRDFLVKGPSSPSQAGCPAYQGSFGTMAEEADKCHRAGCLQGTSGRKKLMHPGSGAWDRGDDWAVDPSMRSSSMHIPPISSVSSITPAQQGARSPEGSFHHPLHLPSICDNGAQHHFSS